MTENNILMEDDDGGDVAPSKPDRDVSDGDIEELVGGDSRALSPDVVGAKEGNILIVKPMRFFKREQKKYGSNELEDVLCMAFCNDENGKENKRYHLKVTGAIGSEISKHYSRSLRELIGTPMKLKVVEINYGKRMLVFRPVPMKEEEEDLNLNF